MFSQVYTNIVDREYINRRQLFSQENRRYTRQFKQVSRVFLVILIFG